MLDSISQRILGVLVEKELTVPESYPLTENSLLSGANQKSNRDPEMSLGSEEVRASLDRLRLAGWVSRVESPGARTRKWRHHFESQLTCSDFERAILVELLLRGPQAPGALKPRIRRLGIDADAPAILDQLEGLANRAKPLVAVQPRRPRERDARWAHLLGPSDETANAARDDTANDGDRASDGDRAEEPVTVQKPNFQDEQSAESPAADLLERRVTNLEREYARILARLEALETSADEN